MEYTNKQKLKDALLNYKLSLALAMNLIAKCQKELRQNGISSFPTVALVGKPGTGKTPAAIAMIGDNEERCLSLVDKATGVMKRLAEGKDTYMLLDDYSKLTSYNGKDARNRAFDYGVRKSFEGKGALLICTMESFAFKDVAEAVALRLIPIPWENGLQEKPLSEMVSHLQQTKDLQKLVDAVNPAEMDFTPIVKELNAYREYHPADKYIAKRPDMVFLYHWSMQILNKIWQKEFSESLFDEQQLVDLENQYLKLECKSSKNYGQALAERVLEYAIYNDYFHPGCPSSPRDFCDHYLKVGCRNRWKCISNTGHRDECMSENNYGLEYTYMPEELILKCVQDTDSIVIPDSDYVPYYNRPYKMPPILIMESTFFLWAMNNALDKMSQERGESEIFFKDQKLKSDLFKIHRIVVIPNGMNGYRYTNSYPMFEKEEEKKTSCIAIILRDEELKILQSRCKIVSSLQYSSLDRSATGKSVHVLDNFFSNIVFYSNMALVGKIQE